jgi:octaprenyl-diphosphate synthase
MARDALALFADTPMKAAMLEAVDFCISRAH